jgi:hypothetical protein
MSRLILGKRRPQRHPFFEEPTVEAEGRKKARRLY